MPSMDEMQRFEFENSNVRGEIVHLQDSWQEVCLRHEYPQPIQQLLGESLAAVALLGSTIKYDGSLILQIQGAGPCSLLVAQITSEQTIRGLVEWNDEVKAGSLRDAFGDGHLIITIERKHSGERYQGIVELGDGGVAQAIEGYFKNSEQLKTKLWLAADNQCAAGLLLQALPGEEEDIDIWDRVVQLASTTEPQELLRLESTTLLHRLFHEETVRIYRPKSIQFHCSCSRERIRDVLRSLGQSEVDEILEEEGSVQVHCHFCNQRYVFDTIDAKSLFVSEFVPVIKKTKH